MQHHAYRRHLPLGLQAAISFRYGYSNVVRAGYATSPGTVADTTPAAPTALPAPNIPSWIPWGSGADSGTNGGDRRRDREVGSDEDANGTRTPNWLNRAR